MDIIDRIEMYTEAAKVKSLLKHKIKKKVKKHGYLSTSMLTKKEKEQLKKKNEAYKVEQNPKDKLWYVVGDIKQGSKTYWMPVSKGYKNKKEAEAFAKKQPKADKAAKKLVGGV